MGTAGHMQHPFDIPNVKTGQDLINYFETIVKHLSTTPGSVKFDGINVSFKLVDDESTPTGKDFRMDRGTTHTESVIGMTIKDAYKFWEEGHGMPPAIDELLTIFNEALPQITPELKTLGMWDDPTKYFNTEYMKKGKTNVIEYDEKILALHSINQFYEKKAPKSWAASGKSMDRPGLPRPTDPKTGKPVTAGSIETDYDRAALESIIEKVKPIAEKYEISLVGDVSTELTADVDFTETLNTPFTIQMTETERETHPLGEWLNQAVNPFEAKVRKRDGKEAWAISKEIYFAVLKGVPLMILLENPEDVKMAINGALFNHATHELGMDVKRASRSSKGGLEGHEGIVIRGLDDRPVKVTGDFIVKGAGGEIKRKISGEEEVVTEAVEKPIDLEYEVEDDFEEPSDKKMVAIYPGRFQPMGRHHAEVYKTLLDDPRFDNVYIATSDKVDMTEKDGVPISPLNFKEKKILASGHGIDPSNFVKVKNPYNAVEITNNLEPGTVVVYFVGCKDMDADPDECEKPRFPKESLGGYTKGGTPKYFRAFEGDEDLKGVEEHAYVAVAPHVDIQIPGLGEMSGTAIRKALKTAEPETFEEIMGFYDPLAYDMIKNKLKRMEESQHPLGIFLRLIKEVLEEASPDPRQDLYTVRGDTLDLTSPDWQKRVVGRHRTQIGRAEEIRREYKRSYEVLKEKFINLNIISKKEQILKAAQEMVPEPISQEGATKILSDIINFIKNTKIELLIGDYPGTDPDYGGPAQYLDRENKVIIEKFFTFWVDPRTGRYPTFAGQRAGKGEWESTIAHELGHAKDAALNRAFNAYAETATWRRPKEQWDDYSEANAVFNRIKHCFPILKRWTGSGADKKTKHHEWVFEFYASLQQMFSSLNRSQLLPEDIQMVCGIQEFRTKIQQLPKKESASWYRNYQRVFNKWRTTLPPQKATPLQKAKPASFNQSVKILSDLTDNEVWKSFDCTKCNPRVATSMLNRLARLDIKNIPQVAPSPQPREPSALVEISLNHLLEEIEETIDEAALTQMYGSWAPNLYRITDPGTELEEESLDEDEELEEMATMSGGSAELGAGKINVEEEGLIREIEDYLFRTLGVDS